MSPVVVWRMGRWGGSVLTVLGLAVGAAGQATPDVSAATAYSRGVQLADQGKWQEAVEWLNRAVAAAPEDAQYQKALGVAYGKLGDQAAAVEPLSRACQLDPKLPDACYYWGQALIALSRFEEALRALELAPASVSPGRLATAQALALDGLGRESAAEARFRAALKSTDYPAESRRRFGIFLYRRGRTAEAAVILEEAARFNPQSAEIALEQGRVYLQLNRLDDAAEALQRAIKLDPTLSTAPMLFDRVMRRRQRP